MTENRATATATPVPRVLETLVSRKLMSHTSRLSPFGLVRKTCTTDFLPTPDRQTTPLANVNTKGHGDKMDTVNGKGKEVRQEGTRRLPGGGQLNIP